MWVLDMLGIPFGLRGKRVRIIKGEYRGCTGTIICETGYLEEYGVVVKVFLDNGYVGEWPFDFIELIDESGRKIAVE